ncbi:hypothetical protein [uncultured Maribacter sp.]|uniref:hypothetical protein n=1 Tax=uncultured Maribacter sp. TaxID=431308 RepID=UPI0030EDFD44
MIKNLQPKNKLVKTSLLYLISPETKGGRIPFEIDRDSFTQIVPKINGYNLLRKADKQTTQGLAMSFVEENEAGDLAFLKTLMAP